MNYYGVKIGQNVSICVCSNPNALFRDIGCKSVFAQITASEDYAGYIASKLKLSLMREPVIYLTRNEEIKMAHREGITFRELGKKYHITYQRIYAICNSKEKKPVYEKCYKQI